MSQSHAALTAKYRPQTFAEVAGQDTLKTILSRAALEGKVAPAYLFSGTRGVGKTTLARIFAKALNCRRGPAAEPCNACDLCRAVTQGNAVDVVEIDGASNRGIDDVRRLKEVVGYAPMEGRYKIFIIDEAHMLSREAFNALLKTLEEPPAGVTFIMATTEPHKFPATIISRCQHYVFKRLSEPALAAHLAGVLEREGVEREETAVRLIARRGAGSVRDAMSLLGQVLALGPGKLTEETARSVLGLAGQEVFLRMVEAFREGDCLSLARLLRDMLDQGLDMGFFLRELSAMWRNMFILRQAGGAALDVVELPEAEARALQKAGEGFSLPQIHACWQMTLEGQRRVLTSLEPALALELLLLNLAMLPRLVPLEQLSAQSRRAASGGPAPAGGGAGGPGNAPGGGTFGGAPGGGAGRPSGQTGGQGGPTASLSAPPPDAGKDAALTDASSPDMGKDAALADASSPDVGAAAQAAVPRPIPGRARSSAPAAPRPIPAKASAPAVPPEGAAFPRACAVEESFDAGEEDEAAIQAAWAELSPSPDTNPPDMNPAISARPGWDFVLERCREDGAPAWFLTLMGRVKGEWRGDILALAPSDAFTAERLQAKESLDILRAALMALCEAMPVLDITAPVIVSKSRDELKREVRDNPLVQVMLKDFGARILDFGQIRE